MQHIFGKNKLYRWLVTIVLVLALSLGGISLALAGGGDTVYISVSNDGKYISAGHDNTDLAYLPVSLTEVQNIDITDFGFAEEFTKDAAGNTISDPTALQLFIYVMAKYYGGTAVYPGFEYSGDPGSIYFTSGLFGFEDSNLTYYVNGDYALYPGTATGATADRITLAAGDYVDVAHYTSYSFWSDSAAGFHYFMDADDAVTHSYTATAGEPLTVELARAVTDWNNSFATEYTGVEGRSVYYDATLYGANAQSATTDDDGQCSLTFTEAGTYYLWADGTYGAENSGDIVSAPAFAMVTVDESATPPAPQPYTMEVNANGITTVTITGAEVVSHSISDTTYNVVLAKGTADGTQLGISFAVSGTTVKLNQELKTANQPMQVGYIFGSISSVTAYTAALSNGAATLSTYCYNGYNSVMGGTNPLRTVQTVNFTVASGVDSIAVTTPPSKTQYVVGQSFDPSGMVVTATADTDSYAVSGYTCSPSVALTKDDTTVTIFYQGITTTQGITVIDRALKGIVITTPPSKTAYFVGDIFQSDGMVVKELYNDDTTGSTITGYACSPSGALALNDTAVTITYNGSQASQPITVNAAADLTRFNLPEGATMTLGSKVRHYYPYTMIAPSSAPTVNGDNTVSYFFELTNGTIYTYEITVAGKAKYAGTFTMSDAINSAGFTIAATAMADAAYISRDHSATGPFAGSPSSGKYVADLFLNGNAAGYLTLASGASYQLHPLRNRQVAENTVTSSNTVIVEPVYHYSVYNVAADGTVSAGDNSIISVDEKGLISAKGSGTAIVCVTYDALTETTAGGLYSAIWPENTGVLAVSVNAAPAALSNISLDSELDVLYYLSTAAGAEYTFTPAAGSTVTLLRPSVSSTALSFSDSFGTAGVTDNGDGSYTLCLAEGRNIVKTAQGGAVSYQVLTAKKVMAAITNNTTPGTVYKPGDSVTVTFDSLYHPANKLAALYNFYAQISYNDSTVLGAKLQYGFDGSANCQKVTFTIPADYTGTEYSLTDGHLLLSGWGSLPGAHRSIDWANGLSANTSAASVSDIHGALPDITLNVTQPQPANTAPTLATGVSATAQADAITGQTWTLDLSTVFTDADSDSLTYQVQINDGAFVNAAASYTYTPAAAGGYTLVFKANDGQADSTATYSVTLTANAAVTANVTLSFQQENEFLLLPQQVAVASDLAESYGYQDSVYSSVSALDVLVKAHELLLAEEFTPETATTYLVVNKGSISRVSGENTYAFSFAVDGDYPYDHNGAYASPLTGGFGYTGYTINQAPVTDNGTVEFFFYQDSMYMDHYTWFEQGGSRVEALTVTAGQSFSLNLQGFMYMFGSYNAADRVTTGAFSVIKDAKLALVNMESGQLTPISGAVTDENGSVTLSLPSAGSYALSALTDNGYTYIVSPWLEITVLTKGGLTDVGAAWKNFRNSDDNMAVTAATTPQSADLTELRWVSKLGTGWSASPSPQIIVDSCLITMVGKTLYKLDPATGAVVDSAAMVAAPSFSYTPPTYAEGMIFCPLGGGKIQAFNAETLDSLWVYTDALGGQALTPITYSDGYLYTGFWLSETGQAAYVCVSVVDENTALADEAKSAAWRGEHVGGFYWAGAAVVGNAVIYGGDNGVSSAEGESTLVSRDKISGALLSSLTLVGDQRSSIAVANGRVYCTTKSGYLYSAAAGADGTLSDLQSNYFGAQSTSTPVVYLDRVYLGCGSGISESGSKGNLLVCQADTLATLYTVGLAGYPQCSLLLSTAYAETDGYLYLYATYNAMPGGVSLIKVKADATSAVDAQLIEVYDAEGYANYCICSLICGPDGTLYYKNDSGNIFALQPHFPISRQVNGSGTISVKNGADEVSQAVAGTTLSVTVTANTGWTLQGLTLNGKALTVSEGAASFTMPAAAAELIANCTQDEGSVLTGEAPSQGSLGSKLTGLTNEEKQALLTAAQGTTVQGLAAAADGLAAQLMAAHPYQELKLDFYLNVCVVAAQVSGGALSQLTLDVTPQYALYPDGSATAAESGAVDNAKLSGSVTITLPAPEGMTVSQYTRIRQGEDWLTPSLKTVGSQTYLVFSLSSFSEIQVYADGRIAAVTFYPEGGKLNGGIASYSVDYYPTDAGAALPVPTRSGYTFSGWYKNAAGSGSKYSQVAPSLPAKLYAVWEEKDGITVSFRLIGDWQHEDGVTGHGEYVTWIKTTSYTLKSGSTVGDLFLQALSDAGLSSKGAAAGYVSSIQAPSELGGYWLSEFSNGHNSGWMYTVNGDHPDKGLNSYTLATGDKVIWHYVDDYTLESESDWNSGSAQYLNRWLTAADITPAQYIQKHGNTASILQVGEGGSVTPSGSKLADYLGRSVTFTITPHSGYQIQDVVVDGKSVGAVSSYTYKNLTVDSRIKVTFTLSQQTATPATPAAGASGFSDLTTAHWAYTYVSSLAAGGVVNGYPNGSFCPDATIKRCDFVVMLARLSGQSLPAYQGQFQDMTAGSYYAQAVAWATAAEVTNGDGRGGFRPEALITRQEMAAMLYRYAAYMKITLASGDSSGFTDSAQIAAYAETAVNAMHQAKIIGGYPDGSFRPLGNATRAEAAKLMYLLDTHQ